MGDYRTDITYRAYRNEVKRIVRDVVDEASSRGQDVGEVLDEYLDGFEWVIYTGAAWMVLAMSEHPDTIKEELGENIDPDNPSLAAFFALRADVLEFMPKHESTVADRKRKRNR